MCNRRGEKVVLKKVLRRPDGLQGRMRESFQQEQSWWFLEVKPLRGPGKSRE